MEASSTRPYLIRAIHAWANDNSLTPFMLVDTRGEGVVVPEQFIKDNSIVLNIAPGSVRDLNIGDEYISFHARFAGKAQEIFVPIQNVRAVYAKENGEGIVLPDDMAPGALIDGQVRDEATKIRKDQNNTSSLTTVKTNGKMQNDLGTPAGEKAKTDEPTSKKPKNSPPTLTIVE